MNQEHVPNLLPVLFEVLDNNIFIGVINSLDALLKIYETLVSTALLW